MRKTKRGVKIAIALGLTLALAVGVYSAAYATERNAAEAKAVKTQEKVKYITEDQAKKVALNEAGLKESEVEKLYVKKDFDKTPDYDISFIKGNIKYEAEVDAVTGKIIDFEKERIKKKNNNNNNNNNNNYNNNQNNGNTSTNTGSQMITREKAKQIALSYAGISSANYFEIELDDGWLYEISFHSGNVEYEVDINAYNGKVVNFEKDYDDDYYGGHHDYDYDDDYDDDDDYDYDDDYDDDDDDDDDRYDD